MTNTFIALEIWMHVNTGESYAGLKAEEVFSLNTTIYEHRAINII